MQYHQHMRENLSQPALLILFCLIDEPKTATALHEAVIQTTGEVSEPGAFSHVVTRLEQGGWIIASDGEGLRLYHLTAQGMLALQDAEEKYRRNQEGPDYNSFGDILTAWLLTGLAGLIIVVAMKIGSRESQSSPVMEQEALQQIKARG